VIRVTAVLATPNSAYDDDDADHDDDDDDDDDDDESVASP